VLCQHYGKPDHYSNHTPTTITTARYFFPFSPGGVPLYTGTGVLATLPNIGPGVNGDCVNVGISVGLGVLVGGSVASTTPRGTPAFVRGSAAIAVDVAATWAVSVGGVFP
jgi:hypothetical protein